MFPVLKKVGFVFILCAIFFGTGQLSGTVVLAQDAPTFTSVRYTILRASAAAKADSIELELHQVGKQGQLIASARSSVLSILTGDNGCSDWYRRSVPDAAEIFRSLHFVVDADGRDEIVKREDSFGNPEYVHPYVAHAWQNEGSGSAIVLNANGAFFKDHARVHTSTAPPSASISQLTRPLVVGDFSGDTAEARTLTLLHEFAHVVGLLPLDSGSPSAAFRSVQNTKTVQKNCKSQIEIEAKQSKLRFESSLLAAPSLRQRSLGPPTRTPGYCAIPPRP